MFGLSLSKIVLTTAVVLVVWYGFKYFNRLARSYKLGARGGQAAEASSTMEDLQKCTICNTFVAERHVPSCDRDECPHR